MLGLDVQGDCDNGGSIEPEFVLVRSGKTHPAKQIMIPCALRLITQPAPITQRRSGRCSLGPTHCKSGGAGLLCCEYSIFVLVEIHTTPHPALEELLSHWLTAAWQWIISTRTSPTSCPHPSQLVFSQIYHCGHHNNVKRGPGTTHAVTACPHIWILVLGREEMEENGNQVAKGALLPRYHGHVTVDTPYCR